MFRRTDTPFSLIFSVVAGTLLASGCIPALPRVKLPELPPLTAAAEDRLKAYDRLRPSSEKQTLTFRSGEHVGTRLDFIMLGGGYRVYDPMDLLAVVDADSPTAGYARDWNKKWQWNQSFTMVTGIAFLAAAALEAVGIATIVSTSSGSFERRVGGICLVSGLGLLVVSPLAMAFGLDRSLDDDRASAFMTYEKDLRARLKIGDEASTSSIPIGPPSARLMPRW